MSNAPKAAAKGEIHPAATGDISQEILSLCNRRCSPAAVQEISPVAYLLLQEENLLLREEVYLLLQQETWILLQQQKCLPLKQETCLLLQREKYYASSCAGILEGECFARGCP